MSECGSVYVHVPFCRAKCGYCDFNSYARQERLIPAYVDALLREATFWAERGVVGSVDTLYFGGGTPSLLPVAETERVVDGLRRLFAVAGDAEITSEANPESASVEWLRAVRRLGVNRLSLGVQSFDDRELHVLGRIHDAALAEKAYRSARDTGFDSVNIDLIFGLPDQTLPQWRRSLEKAVALEPDHLSLYALTLEDGTPLAGSVTRGECPGPDNDAQAEMYTWSSACLAAAGYEQYEISNWAKPGHRCRHNLTYWHAEPYLGLGAGAHSYVDGCRLANERRPGRYIELVDESADAKSDPWALPHVESFEAPDAEREMSDAIILGLRLTEGVSLDTLGRRFGVNVGDRFGEEITKLTGLGLLESVDGRVRLTERGRLLGNEVFQRFLL
jgi:oxygen-independent coproporphyrinogen-3 oxidase